MQTVTINPENWADDTMSVVLSGKDSFTVNNEDYIIYGDVCATIDGIKVCSVFYDNGYYTAFRNWDTREDTDKRIACAKILALYGA